MRKFNLELHPEKTRLLETGGARSPAGRGKLAAPALPASQQRACALLQIAVSSFRYQSRRNDEPLRARLVELAREKPRFGYRRLHILLDRGGEHMNQKRVYRVYREAELTVKRKTRKRLVRLGSPRPVLTAANQEWALDSAHDGMASGRAMRVLSVVDACTRECLALEVDTSYASRRVTWTLESILAQREKLLAIRCDNGPELTSRHFLAWCIERQIELVHIQPGKPQQNGHVESFHARLHDECLNVSWFENLWDAWRKIAAWRKEDNEERPHSSLSYQTPSEYARQLPPSTGSRFALRQAKEPTHRMRMSYDPPCGSGGQVTGATSRENYDKRDVVHCVSEAGSLSVRPGR